MNKLLILRVNLYLKVLQSQENPQGSLMGTHQSNTKKKLLDLQVNLISYYVQN
jgi:hypothetical protein